MRVALILVAIFPSLVQAQLHGRGRPVSRTRSSSASVGEQVITRYAKPLKVGKEVVDDGTAFRIYRVAQVKGDWLWLESGRVSGWVEAGNVVPYSQAVEHFTQQIAVPHKAASAYACRGIVRHANGEYDAAIADYDEALRLDPKLALAYYNRGLAWQKKQHHDKAIADYGEALRLDPKYALAYRTRGSAWHAKQDYDRALADYDAALRLDPKHALTYHNRGLAWCAKQDFDKALADCSEAIRLDPQSAVAYRTRGLAWQKKQHHDQAIADYDEAIRLAPDDPIAHNNLAWLFATCRDETRRDGKRAAESATRACELSGWCDWRFLHTLAAACAETGDFDNAVKHGELALSMAPAEHRQRSEEVLEAYKAGKPHREQAVD